MGDYESYDDFYDNGPGSENFKRKIAQSAKDDEENRKKHPTSHSLCTMCPVLEERVDKLKKRNKNLMLHFEDLKRQNAKLKKENKELDAENERLEEIAGDER